VRGPAASLEPLPERLERLRVQHVSGRGPGAARHEHTPARELEFGDRVRVRRDHQLDAAVPGQPRVAVGEVEPVAIRIDLERHAVGVARAHLVADVHRAQADPAVDRRYRTSPMLLLGMYREMFRHSEDAGIRYWFAAMERSLAHALKKMGFRFMAIGPEANYYGSVTPYVLDLHDLRRKLATSNPALAAWFAEKPPVVEHAHPSRVHVVRNPGLGNDIN